MQTLKAILGGALALFAIAALANIAIYLRGRGATDQSGTAQIVIVYTLMFLLCAGGAIYLLRSAFGKKRLPPQ